MLIKPILQNKIESALEKAMKEAYLAALQAVQDTSDKKSVSQDKIASDFAAKAKTCAADIATAIDDYIKSAQITLNVGTLMTPMPTLISPVGPVTGVITLAAPTILMNSIS